MAVVLPPVGLLSAMGLLWGVAFHPVDLILLVSLYVICAFGTTIGFHRYFTHRGFTAQPAVKATLAILGCMTMQGPVRQWVTDHRKHHALSDQPGDPHSPHGHREGFGGALRGFVHAHVGWLFTNLGMEQGRAYSKDLYDDADVMTSRQMIECIGLIRGRRPLIVKVPVLTPRLSSYWLHLLTPAGAAVAGPLIEGLRNATVVRDGRIRELIPIELTPFEAAVRAALDNSARGRGG